MKPLKAIALTLLAVAAALISGCAPPNDSQDSSSGAGKIEYTLPAAVKEDDLYIYGDDFYYERYQDSTVPLTLRFTIISGKELDPEKIFLSAETDIPCAFLVKDLTDESPLPYNLFLAYNQGEEYFNLDWKEVYAKRKVTEDLLNEGKFLEAEESAAWEKEYIEIYDRLARSEFPPFYVYRAEIYFNYGLLDEFPSKPVEKIEIDINGQKHALSGKIAFVPGYETAGSHGVVDPKTIASGGYNLIPMSEGRCVLPPISFSAKEDTDLTGISFFSEAVTVDAARLIIESGGAKMDVLWDCKSPLKIKKGSEVEAVLIIRDRDFEGKLSYVTDYHIIFEFESRGVKSSFKTEVEGYTRLPPFEMLAILRDGVDLLPYYYEYYGRIKLEDKLK